MDTSTRKMPSGAVQHLARSNWELYGGQCHLEAQRDEIITTDALAVRLINEGQRIIGYGRLVRAQLRRIERFGSNAQAEIVTVRRRQIRALAPDTGTDDAA